MSFHQKQGDLKMEFEDDNHLLKEFQHFEIESPQEKGDVTRSAVSIAIIQGDQQLKGKSRSRGKNWSDEETDILLRRSLELASNSRVRNGPIWQKISDSLQKRTPKECQQRWNTLLKLYTRIKAHQKPLSEWTLEDFQKSKVPPSFSRFTWYDMLKEHKQKSDQCKGSQLHDMNAPEPSLTPLKFDSNKSTIGDCKGGSHQSEVPLSSISKPLNDPRLPMDWEEIGMPTCELDLPTLEEIGMPTPEVDLPTLEADLSILEVDLPTSELETWFQNLFNSEEVVLFHEEVAKIDNILELPMDFSSPSFGITVLCCYNAKESSFEFLFNNREDMAQVVGVGLEFAKAVLIEGWKVHVKEMSEEDWRSQRWNISQSGLTMVYRLLSILLEESSSHGTNDRDVVFQRPLLWDLAKYFTLQETIATLEKKKIFAQSANTGGASSSNPQVSSNQNNQDSGGGSGDDLSASLTEGFRRWFPYWWKGNGKDNEEGSDGHNNQPEDPSDPDTGPASANATVSVELMKGGSFDDVVGMDDTLKQKLKSTKNIIASNLEFTFTNQGEEKDIQITVGRLAFALDPLDDANAGERCKVVWSHRDPKVSFGLEGNNVNYGEVVRDSFMHLDIVSKTTTTKSSQTMEKKKGKDNLVRGEAFGAPHGVGIRGAIERKNRTEANDIQLLETSFESDREQTTDGLWFNVNDDEYRVACQYLFHPKNIEWPLSPMFRDQKVRFQATWDAYDNMRFVEYTLKASRILQEVQVETYKALDIDKKRKKTKQWALGCGTSMDAVQAFKPYKQTFSKKLLVNHEMSHLDGKTHQVRERVDNQNGSSYFSKTRGGKLKPYTWGSSEHLKFPRPSLRTLMHQQDEDQGGSIEHEESSLSRRAQTSRA